MSRKEMLIVIVVIAILALIVIPRLLGLGRKEKELALRSNLLLLRNAIQQFEADCGDFPAELSNLTMHELNGGTKGGRGIVLDPKGWAKSWPFLKTPDGKLSVDPFTEKADWNYDPKTGEVHSGSTLTGINGQKYSTW